ncbi:MAG: helix-turn-helix domain-containing protein [Propionibacteriaceae bacterium]|jgi:DNA-binding XRE family transcriptional regulator|nr:helix-turn-helix domain-containing protein [Propionibacteriaceae bacterium]
MSKITDLVAARSAADPEFAHAYAAEDERLRVAVALTRLREAEGLTQRQLAALAGKPQSTIARIENGTVNPSLQVLGEIAACLGRRLDVRFVPA